MYQAITLITKNKIINKLTAMNLKSIYTENNNTLRMLIGLVNKWNDKSYDLTDTEWDTIKSYKTLLDTHFNQVESMQKTIDLNEQLILKLN